jgi:putative endonuclease
MNSASPRKPLWRRWFGSRSERAAVRYLRRLGHRVVARNWQCPLGELDLVTVDQGCVVFVEVRSTEQEETERPAASVGPQKQERLTQLALAFLKKHGLLGRAARFDVLAVSWPEGMKEPRIEHFANAFEAVGRFQTFS